MAGELGHLTFFDCDGCGLEEELNGMPCYTSKNNVVLYMCLKIIVLLFFKGAPAVLTPILVQQTANVQAGGQLRFTSVNEITKLEKTI